MSTFRAFQTGLEAGQKQAKVKREDDARMKASEAYGMGNYEGAVTGLMGAGLLDEANAYGQAGERGKAEQKAKAVATALGSSPDRMTSLTAARGAAQQFDDPAMMLQIDEWARGAKAEELEQFGQGMSYLAQTAMGLKNVSPELRADEAMKALQNSPYANPQILAQIQQAGADGLITNDELQAFVDRTLSVKDRLEMAKAAKPNYNTATTREGVIAYNDADPSQTVNLGQAPLPASAQGGGDTYRPATTEDRAKWGLPPEGAFKINERTGEVAAISGARAAQDFSPTEVRGFRDQADGLYILQNAVNQYVTMLEKMGGPQLLDTPFNAENSQALKSAHGLITEAIKDAGKLGALDQGVQNLVNAIIQEPVGWGTFGKSTESIKQAANQLNSSIEFKLSRVPEEYRAGSTGKVPSAAEEDDEDNAFLDKLFGKFDQISDAPPAGVDPALWAVMDDEDKAAFR